MASLQALMQDYDQHVARLEELRDRLEEQLTTARADMERAAVEAALARMDRGLYGTCLRCGAFIPYELLRAAPHELLCADCGGGTAA